MLSLQLLLLFIKTLTFAFKANDFECIDDTSFRHYIDSDNFVIKRCASSGLCFTRNPPNKNPCIGKVLALQIDKN